MSTAIVTAIMMGLLLTSVAVLGQQSFTALRLITDAWSDMEDRGRAMVRTDISTVSTSYSPPTLDVTVLNAGQEPLRDFAKWDVVVQYYEVDGTYHSIWLPFTTASPVGDNQWRVVGLYLDAATSKAESSQPNILDPGEELVIRIGLTPAADAAANNVAVIGTPNATTLSTPF